MMSKIETKEEIEFRIKLGKRLLDDFRGKIINREQAKKILRLTNYRFKVTQVVGYNNLLMVNMQEIKQYNELNVCTKEYEHKEELGNPLFFLVKTKSLINY